MYEAFYGLLRKPFSIQPDPDLIYWGRLHRMAFAMLEFGIVNHAGFIVITGEIGSGKTTLVRHLLRRFGSSITTGIISNTPRQRDELLRWIMLSLHQPMEGDFLTVFARFQNFVVGQAREGRSTVIIIDEAQNLGIAMLEELRMLSNMNVDDQQYLQLILIGQPELKDQLRDPALVQFAQRVGVDFHLRALDEADVVNYIEFRLRAVGASRRIFSNEACALVAKASRGVPRVINILCDTAMVYGFSAGSPNINTDLIEQVIADKQTFGIFPIGSA